MLDADAEQDLSMQLNIRSLPTVYGLVGGQVVDAFVGGQPKEVVESFVTKLARHSQPLKQEEEIEETTPSAAADSDDPAESVRLLTQELADLRAVVEPKRRLPKEFDEKLPEAKRAATILEAIARGYLAMDDRQAAAATLADLRDTKRAAVIEKHPDLKQAVARLALALVTPDQADLRDLFDRDQVGAIEAALDLVKAANNDDDRDRARRLVLDFIDALGPSPDATRARKRASPGPPSHRIASFPRLSEWGAPRAGLADALFR